MSRLVDHVHGGKTKSSASLAGGENGDHLAYGIQLRDGVVHTLEGQPPLATSKGWGSLAFVRSGSDSPT